MDSKIRFKHLQLFLSLLVSTTSVFAQFEPQEYITYSTGHSIVSFYNFDVDGDSLPDAVMNLNSVHGQGIYWYSNKGNGEYGNQQWIDLSNEFENANSTIYDVNNDGDLDIVMEQFTERFSLITSGHSTRDQNSQLVYFENNLNGTFTKTAVLIDGTLSLSNIKITELNADSLFDIVLTNRYGIEAYENQGNNTFLKTLNKEFPVMSDHYEVADFNNDGKIDIVSLESDSFIWYQNNYDSIDKWQKNTLAADTVSHWATFGDLNNDDSTDMIQYKNNAVLYFKSCRLNQSPDTLFIKEGIEWFEIRDLDLDGLKDFMFYANSSSYKNVRWKKQQSLLAFEDTSYHLYSTNNTVFYNNSQIPLYDMDKDGDLDLFIVRVFDNYSNAGQYLHLKLTVHKFENDGNMNFSEIDFNFSSQIQNVKQMLFEDLNNDGLEDLVTVSIEDNKISWFENLGNEYAPVKKISSFFKGGSYPYTVFVDIDMDDDLDLVYAGSYNDDIWYYSNNGEGVFDSLTLLFEGDKIEDLIKFDADDDGDLDLLFKSGTQDTVRIDWLEYDTISKTYTDTHNIFLYSGYYDDIYPLKLLDIDADGDLDIYLPHRKSESWLENEDSSVNFTKHLISTSMTYNYTGVGDIDGDGDNDLLKARIGAYHLSWMEYINDSTFVDHEILNEQGNIIRNALLCDVDSDDDLDIVYSQYNSQLFKPVIDPKLVWIENNGDGTFSKVEHNVVEYPRRYSMISKYDIDHDSDDDLFLAMPDIAQISTVKNVSNNFKTIHGLVYWDVNNNGLLDSLEQVLENVSLNSVEVDVAVKSDKRGIFELSSFMEGELEFKMIDTAIWSFSDSNSNIINFDSLVNDDTIFIGLARVDSSAINKFSIISQKNICSNTKIPYWVYINNNGLSLFSGIIDFYLDTMFTYVSSSIAYDSLINQHIYFSIDSLEMNADTTILFYLNSDSNQEETDVMQYASLIVNNDSTNLDSVYQSYSCERLSNSKTVDKGRTSKGYIGINETALVYTIFFENSDSSEQLIIQDVLDDYLDYSTIELLSASHPINVSLSPYGEISFEYEDILNDSIGYVQFKIEIDSDLALGKSIVNSAQLYFDKKKTTRTDTVTTILHDCDSKSISISDSIGCVFNTVSFRLFNMLDHSEINWFLNDSIVENSSRYYWYPKDSGLFDIRLTVNNGLCSFDTQFVFQVNNNDIEYDTTYVCPGDSVLIFNEYKQDESTYYSFNQGVNKCDSNIFHELIWYSISNTISDTINVCSGDVYQFANHNITQSGFYNDTLINIYGCDSIDGKRIELLDSIPITTDTIYTCWLEGTQYVDSLSNQKGIQTFVSQLGCDSLVDYVIDTAFLEDVFFINSVDSVICYSQGSIDLGYAFPWGGEFSADSLVDKELFFSDGVGDYTVMYQYEYLESGCITKDSFVVQVDFCTSMYDLFSFSNVDVGPNPTNDHVILSFSEPLDGKVKVYNFLGQLASEENLSNQDELLILLKGQPGIYIIKIEIDGNKSLFYKIVKE